MTDTTERLPPVRTGRVKPEPRAQQRSGTGPGKLHPDEGLDAQLIRQLILTDPELVLSDGEVMRTLIGAEASPIEDGRRIVDLRQRLIARLEDRLERLRRTHRSVIAAAYENVAGTQQVQRAILALLEVTRLQDFLAILTRDVPGMLGVEECRFCLEAEVEETGPAHGLSNGLGGRVIALPLGTVEAYLSLDGEAQPGAVVLRSAPPEAEILFGHREIRSEALIRLDFAELPGLVAFGAHDPYRFQPHHGTDLLTFFGGTIERVLGHWLGLAAGER